MVKIIRRNFFGWAAGALAALTGVKAASAVEQDYEYRNVMHYKTYELPNGAVLPSVTTWRSDRELQMAQHRIYASYLPAVGGVVEFQRRPVGAVEIVSTTRASDSI